MKVLITLLCLLSTGTALADPGVGTFTNTRAGRPTNVVSVGGGTLLYLFTGTIESVAFSVNSGHADVCFDTDIGSVTVGSARVGIRRAANPANPVLVSSLLMPAVPSNNTNCLQIVNGTYWIEPTIALTTTEVPLVTITGRN